MTFPEFLILQFTISLPIVIGSLLARRLSPMVGIATGLFLVAIDFSIIYLFLRSRWRRKAHKRKEYREKYTSIYKVLILPSADRPLKKARGAEMRIGDYGWEAAPLRDDGLIYLQGLNLQWRVVWYAGFHPNQIENVVNKPQSQYDWNYTWIKEPPSCPFPVQQQYHPTINLGLPVPEIVKRSKA